MYKTFNFLLRSRRLRSIDTLTMSEPISLTNDKVYYAVGKGREIGIYNSWQECKAQIEEFTNAKFRKFYSLEEAKEFVNFWKNYSGKDTVQTKNSEESDGNAENVCENSKNCDIKEEPVAEQESTLQQHQSTSHLQLRQPSPCRMMLEGRILNQKDIDLLALTVRLDSLEKRFDTSLKDVGALASEISHLTSEVKKLKEALSSGMQLPSGSSPRKGKDGLLQMTLPFTGSSSTRSASEKSAVVDWDEEALNKKGRNLKRKLSKRACDDGLDGDDIVETLSKTIKMDAVEMSSFNVDDNGFVEVYTDGSTLSNGKCNAKAGIGVWFGEDHPLNVAEPVVGNATNIVAEIQAARVAAELAIKAGVKKLKILTDSEFLINCATKWIIRWKKNGWTSAKGEPVKNRTELERLDSVTSKIQVRWEKVAAHSKIKGNEIADRLANLGAARRMKLNNDDEDDSLHDKCVPCPKGQDEDDP